MPIKLILNLDYIEIKQFSAYFAVDRSAVFLSSISDRSIDMPVRFRSRIEARHPQKASRTFCCATRRN
jgi:hypothetical protein